MRSPEGQRYLGAMRAAINVAVANRQVITHFTRDVCARVLLPAALRLLYDVSHNTCKVEEHVVDGRRKTVYIHRKDATRLADRPQRVGQTGVAGLSKKVAKLLPMVTIKG